jgi:serine/threonine protein kinase
MALEASGSTMQSIGDYDVTDKIAEGGMGTVYKGKHRFTGQVVAIKVVPPNMLNNQVLLKRFENEFRAASKLNHPNVVRAIDYGTVAGRPYLVMEYVDGESLGQRLERDGRISEDESVRMVSLAAKGLQEAHTHGLIHRDIKPDNIMITRDGQVKIADLGLVKETEADLNLTRTGRGLGTPHFMSPEQFRNAKNADVKCDIYSLGATMYMMVTGELPFGNCNGPLDAWMKKVQNDLPAPRKLLPSLSERVDAAIQRSMSPDPKVRQTTCLEFIADLAGEGTARPVAPAAQPANADVWYLIYKDEEGVTHTVKGSTSGIRRSYQDGLLGDASNIRACRTKTGSFESLLSVSEFRDLAASAAGGEAAAATPKTPTTPQHLPNVRTDSGFKAPDAPVMRPATPNPGPHIAGLETEKPALPEWAKLSLIVLVAMALGMALTYLITR